MDPGSRFACPGRRAGRVSSVIASAAKQSRATHATLDCFAALAMTVILTTCACQTYASVLAARFARVMQELCPSKIKEGAGNAGCPMDPRPPVQQEAQASTTTGSPGTSGIPCAMVLTVSFALSLVTGLF